MPGFKLHEPIPIAEIITVDETILAQLIDGNNRLDIHQGQADYPYLCGLVGLADIPLRPTRYTLQRAVSGIVNCWHLDGARGFFESNSIAVFASPNPTRVLTGEIPVYQNSDWPNLTDPNSVVEASLKADTAQVITLKPNIYYLLEKPAIHCGPERIEPDPVRLSGRCIIEQV